MVSSHPASLPIELEGWVCLVASEKELGTGGHPGFFVGEGWGGGPLWLHVINVWFKIYVIKIMS